MTSADIVLPVPESPANRAVTPLPRPPPRPHPPLGEHQVAVPGPGGQVPQLAADAAAAARGRPTPTLGLDRGGRAARGRRRSAPARRGAGRRPSRPPVERRPRCGRPGRPAVACAGAEDEVDRQRGAGSSVGGDAVEVLAPARARRSSGVTAGASTMSGGRLGPRRVPGAAPDQERRARRAAASRRERVGLRARRGASTGPATSPAAAQQGLATGAQR